LVVTVAKGYDLGYIWKTQAQPGAGHATGGYYLNAARVLPGAQDPHFGGVQDADEKPGIPGGVVGQVPVPADPRRLDPPRPGRQRPDNPDRYERIRRERAGYLSVPILHGQPQRADRREPIAVLADVLSRDGAELSASAIRQRNLSNADYLGILHAIWTAETAAARHDRYRDLVMAALPPGRRQPLSHQARWLFRTLDAELAGLDPAEVIATAIASRDLAGLLARHGDPDGAAQILRAWADAGDRAAAVRLIDLLAERGDLDALRDRADAGDREAAWRLARLLEQRGDLEALRARTDAGDEAPRSDWPGY